MPQLSSPLPIAIRCLLYYLPAHACVSASKASLAKLCVAMPLFFDPSLGNLSRLPPEIRLQIWDLFSLYPIECGVKDPAFPKLRQPRLAVLQTSHRIHDEVSKHLYKDVVLRFHVLPEYQYRSWLTVEGNTGTKWYLQNLDDAVSRGFAKLPYEKLKGIQVEIDAPCRFDPGQIVCLWKKCLDLAALLEQAERGLPNLEIHLKDSESAKWSVDSEPQMSVAVDRVKSYPPRDAITDRSNEQTDIKNADYEFALIPFHRLRNVQTAKVYLPGDMVCNNEYAYNTETILTEKEPFGTWLKADDPWNDQRVQADQDQIFMDLDVELDLLPGITANMLRLERFSSWYTNGLDSASRYENELQRIIKTRSYSRCNYNEPEQIQYRYAAMRAFNPRSLFHWYKAPKSWDMPTRLVPSTDATTIQEAIVSGTIKEEWDADTWHSGCYPSGIPQFDEDAFLTKLWTAGLNFVLSVRYEREFHDKLMGWVGDDEKRCFSSVRSRFDMVEEEMG